MKSKESLIKQFNKVQKEYIACIRDKRFKDAEIYEEERNYIQLQIRRLDKRYER